MTAPERIALRWETGAAVTNGPLMTHPDYTRYIREDVAQTYHDAWMTAEGMLEEAQCQIKAMKEDAAKPRVKPLVWREYDADWPNWFYAVTNVGRYEIGPNSEDTFSCYVEPQMRNIGLSFLAPDDAKAAAQADYEARILSALVLP